MLAERVNVSAEAVEKELEELELLYRVRSKTLKALLRVLRAESGAADAGTSVAEAATDE